MSEVPCIWWDGQPVRHAAAHTVERLPRREEGTNRWFLFRRAFTLIEVPPSAATRVTVDGRYRLFVNGVHAGSGPVRCSPLDQRFDVHDLAPMLRGGANAVGLIVQVPGVDLSWYETIKGLWQPVFGDGALWMDGPVVRGDLTWRALHCRAWDSDTPRINDGLGFVESFDARLFPSGWLDPSFDDSAWDGVIVQLAGGGGPSARMGGTVVRPFPIRSPNPLPTSVSSTERPERCVWTAKAVPEPDLPIERRIYEEALQAIDVGTTPRLPFEADDRNAALFDFGRLRVGRPWIEVNAHGGETIDIAVAERLPGQFTEAGIAPEARIVPRPFMGADAHVTRYVCRPGPQRFLGWNREAVRWMQIAVRDAPPGLRLDDIGIVEDQYPALVTGAFDCDDPAFNRLWRLGADTLTLCMSDGWEDCPGREQRQWLGDAAVEYLAARTAFGAAIDPLHAKFLVDAARSQRPDGLLQMFAPGDHGRDWLLIPDWTLMWVLSARDYWRWSGDSETIEEVLPAVLSALQWFARAQQGPLLSNVPYWGFLDWAAYGREHTSCVVNALLAGARDAAAELADAVGAPGPASRLRASAFDARTALGALWDATRGVYSDELTPDGPSLRVSQHAQAAMILWGGASVERWPAMIARAADPARAKRTAAPPIVPSSEPFDEREDVVATNTFFSHFWGEALARAGRTDLMLTMLRSRYCRMLEVGADTLWESTEPNGSLCHGFSATPTWQLTHSVLGLAPAAPGCAAIRWAPDLASLSRASGRIETGAGPVEVSINAVPGGCVGAITAASSIRIDMPHARAAGDGLWFHPSPGRGA